MTQAPKLTPGIAVLTGGTSGLGRYVARGLVQAGWHLVLIARDPVRAEALRAWLGLPALEVELADLSLLAEARRAAAAIAARHPAIGLLLLNAGTFQPTRITTAEGHELVLAVNHLAPHVLIGALAPSLAPGARIVTVGSSSSDRADIDPDDLELVRGWNLVRAYARSKLAVLTTGLEWARRLAPDITFTVAHPGFVATDLVRAGGPIGLVWRTIARFALTAEQGAATPLRAALDPAPAPRSHAGLTGQYLKPGGPARPNRRALDPALAARVWAATERLTQPPSGP